MDTTASTASIGPVKPLGLPVGSVRALLALAVTARLLLDLHDHGTAAAWLVATVLIHAVTYFGVRAAGGGPRTSGRAPLGLPGGTVRLLLLAGLCAAAWLYLRDHDVAADRLPVLWVLAGFGAGVIARALYARMRMQQDSSAPLIYHLQALVTLGAAAGLVALGFQRGAVTQDWVEPLLAAFTTFYVAVR